MVQLTLRSSIVLSKDKAKENTQIFLCLNCAVIISFNMIGFVCALFTHL